MPNFSPKSALALVGTLVTTLNGCQQVDQLLPFEIDPTQAQTLSVNSSGGVVSLPPNFSIEFLPGSLTGSQMVSAQQRLATFPADAGLAVPGRAFDVGPAGVQLSPTAPARVQIAVPPSLLAAGDALTLSVAVLRPDNSIVTDARSYDAANGILTAYVYELGPMAAVVATDAIVLGDINDVPPLDGGAITPVSPAPAQGARAPSRPDGVEYTADCSPGERSCFTSGIAKLWVDDVVRARLGSELVLLNTTVEASIEFFAFNLSSLPDSAVGHLRIDGDLRARINQVVASRKIGDEVALYTGNGTDPNNPLATAISISGGDMTVQFTSQDDPEVVEFDISGVGTSDLLTIQVEGELSFENASGPPTVGNIVAHVRLRR
jgi:hypothetical protein